MNIRRFALAAAFAVPIAVTPVASAQVTTDDTADDTADTATGIAGMENQTVLSGFVGGSFGGDRIEEESVDFGGSLSWLWSSVVGAEFLAGFAPDFGLEQAVDETQVNSYMFNAIAAVPLGENRRWQPFVSGGIGALTLSTDDELEIEGLAGLDETELGSNIGFGIMGFADRWGFRGDVRYFSQVGDPDDETVLLDDLDFWRGNVGIAYRW